MEMISKSIQVLFSQNPAIHTMFEEGECPRGEYGSDKVYDFSLGNLDIPAPAEVEQAIREVLTEEPSISIHGYMNNAGFADLRTAIADSLQKRFGLTYRADQLIMTTDATAALNIFLKTALNSGDEVLTFAPYLSEYKSYAQNYGDVLRLVATDPETFLSDLDVLCKAVGEKTYTLILSMPNNLNRVVYSGEMPRGIQGVLAEKEQESGNCILAISDEPYHELAYDGAMIPWIPALMPHAAVVYSYSKTLSLPGERTSQLLLPDSAPETRELCTTTVIADRISGSVNASLLIQRALKRTLGYRANFLVYEHNRILLLWGLPKVGYRSVKLEGTFYLLIRASEGGDAAFAVILKKKRILTVPCKGFVCPDYVRLAHCVVETTVRDTLPGFRRTAEFYKAKGLL